MKKIILVLFLLHIMLPAHAQSDIGRFATKDDLIGFWELTPLHNAEALNKVNPWPQPYQWFGFYENGRVVSMQTTKYESQTAAALNKVFLVLKDISPTFKFDRNFLVIENQQMQGYSEVWGVNIFIKDTVVAGNSFKKGDLIMTLAGGKDGKPVYYRHLRRIK